MLTVSTVAFPKLTDAGGNTGLTAYNALGLVAYVEDAAANRTEFIYDQFGRNIETVDAIGNSAYTVYDLRNNVIKQWGATYPVWYEYDSEGRMTEMATTRDTSVALATITSLDDPSLDKTQWLYDPATGVLMQKLYDDGNEPSYTYTPDGQLATRTWARGVMITYSYDNANQLTGVTYSDDTPAVSFTYDRLGRQLSAALEGDMGVSALPTACVSEYQYDHFLNLTNETTIDFGATNSLLRAYDAFGRTTGYALHTHGGRVSPPAEVSYYYDDFGRFARVGTSVSASPQTNDLAFTYSYLDGTRLVSGYTSSSGHSFTRSFEPHRNLISAITNAFKNTAVSSFDYTNDPLGRRTKRNDDIFGYNIRSEVTSANIKTQVESPIDHSPLTIDNSYSYDYDPIGNRISSSSVIANEAKQSNYAANELNQYTEITSTIPGAPQETPQPQYDLDGNMISDGTLTYAWDGENRLVGIYSNNTVIASYTYDHRSRRIAKSTSGADIFFTYDGWNLIQEITVPAANSLSFVICHYLWGLDFSGSLQNAGGVGGLLAVINDNVTFAPCYDANGNITDYTDSSGTLVAHYEYSPFGEVIMSSGDFAYTFAFRFSTKCWEKGAALYYYGYRLYAAVMGRWLNRDPISEFGGANLYGYVKNNSLDFFDTNGFKTSGSNDGVAEDTECSLQPCKDTCYKHLNHPDQYVGEYCFEECIRGCERTKMHFEQWFNDNADLSWTNNIPDCPCNIGKDKKAGDNPGIPRWGNLKGGEDLHGFHVGASVCMRSYPSKDGHANQCCYNECGELITHGSGSGSADKIPAKFPFYPHYDVDVRQAEWARLLDGGGRGCWSEKYLLRRPQKGAEKCPKKP